MPKHEANDRGMRGYFLPEDSQARLAKLRDYMKFLSRLAEPRTADEGPDSAPEVDMEALAICLELLEEQADKVLSEVSCPRCGSRATPRAMACPTRRRSRVPKQQGAIVTSRPVVLINVFTVEPSRQDDLIELLTRATQDYVRLAEGFVSARLHRSLDGTKVTMYAEWRSKADYEAMREDPNPLPFLRNALEIATFEPGMYEVVQTFAPAKQ